MSDTKAQVSVLKQTADPAVADAIVKLIESGQDHELNRINVLGFCEAHRARRRSGDRPASFMPRGSACST